jgi:hypothetical protein
MMRETTSTVFSMMEKLAKSFPTALLCYAYSNQEQMHVVDMSGTAIEKLSEDEWAELHDGLVDEFESNFVNDALLFVREGSLVRITQNEAEHTICPKTSFVSAAIGELVHGWVSNSVVMDFAYEVYQKVGDLGLKRPKAKKSMGASPPQEIVFNYAGESVPEYSGTDSFFCLT